MARRTKYRPKYSRLLIEYFDIPAYVVQEESFQFSNGRSRKHKTLVPNDLPTLERFAASIGVDDDTLQNWADARNEDGSHKYPEFFGAYRAAKNIQKHILITNGLRGLYASNFAIFVAQNLLGMRERSEVDITTNGEPIGGVVNISNYKEFLGRPREELEQLVREKVKSYRKS